MGQVNTIFLSAAWTGLCLTVAPLAPAADTRVDFNHHIRPLLSDRCFNCHGPDEKARKAKLRLDTPEGAFAMSKGEVPVIKKGDPEHSEVFRRLVSNDDDEKMPPPESNLVLTSEEIDLIKKWIAQGAEWKPHWSFIPPQKSSLPKTNNRSWARTPIDQFVLAELEKQKLQPSPESNKERLLRRVTFDLTGLPPTVAEVDAFLSDSSPNAYEKVIDRLLASSSYGERMATEWLDIARYADTHGYQIDRYRATWPWRDWVIQAFNRNLPFDQFVTWQLAGDLLPQPTQEQRLATAFNRHHMQTEEGGSVEEEFRVAYVTDRVNTFGTAFLGLTLECARCHDHKYDPISQKDFYQLFSFFNNIDESGQNSFFTDSVPVPTLLLADEKTEARLAQLQDKIRSKEAELSTVRTEAFLRFERWLQPGDKPALLPGLAGAFSLDQVQNNQTPNAVETNKPGAVFESPKLIEGKKGQALEFSGENGVSIKSVGAFSRVDPFSITLWAKAAQPQEKSVIIHRTRASLDAGSRGYELSLENGKVVAMLTHMWPRNSIKISTHEIMPTNEWVHLSLVYDGSSKARGLQLYWNGKLADVEIIRDGLFKDITFDTELTIAQRFRDKGFKNGAVDDVQVFKRALSPLEVAHLAGTSDLPALLAQPINTLSPEQKNLLFGYYFSAVDPEAQKYLAELRAVRQEHSQLVNPIPEIMVMEEMSSPRPAFVLKRGAYDSPGEAVQAGTPSSLSPWKESFSKNRLGLAQWLLDSRNPLMARVTVNRYWQLFHGRGLVNTPDDFGAQGSLPSHPELLDWLAIDFRESGWNLKRLHKMMVMSATYRQSSAAPAESMAADPENKFLSRGPGHRLSAEMIRDNALATSGLLVPRQGGPSVKPYQPEGLWEEKSGTPYDQDKGEGLYRKSLYTFWKRTSPHPAMVTFDSSERNICAAKRQRTSTPLQALVLLNDVQYAEAARMIAQRMLREGGTSTEDRIRFAFRLLTSRQPQAAEMKILSQLYQEQMDLYQKNPESARAWKANGLARQDDHLNPVEHAACAQVASALLNFDETFMKR